MGTNTIAHVNNSSTTLSNVLSYIHLTRQSLLDLQIYNIHMHVYIIICSHISLLCILWQCVTHACMSTCLRELNADWSLIANMRL